jgi:hypothetical protein
MRFRATILFAGHFLDPTLKTRFFSDEMTEMGIPLENSRFERIPIQ